ncbi:unnamed protein product, partial [Gongylonema pulchrum]|uniref:C2 NT-type domain-containing protein n=1 Tax=Gongylonema pulchrum TaxID=637853 RepID=A0A183D063_9BILA
MPNDGGETWKATDEWQSKHVTIKMPPLAPTVYSGTTRKTYWVEATDPNAVVEVELVQAKANCAGGCYQGAVEAKFAENPQLTGAKFCCVNGAEQGPVMVSHSKIFPLILTNVGNQKPPPTVMVARFRQIPKPKKDESVKRTVNEPSQPEQSQPSALLKGKSEAESQSDTSREQRPRFRPGSELERWLSRVQNPRIKSGKPDSLDMKLKPLITSRRRDLSEHASSSESDDNYPDSLTDLTHDNSYFSSELLSDITSNHGSQEYFRTATRDDSSYGGYHTAVGDYFSDDDYQTAVRDDSSEDDYQTAIRDSSSETDLKTVSKT